MKKEGEKFVTQDGVYTSTGENYGPKLRNHLITPRYSALNIPNEEEWVHPTKEGVWIYTNQKVVTNKGLVSKKIGNPLHTSINKNEAREMLRKMGKTKEIIKHGLEKPEHTTERFNQENQKRRLAEALFEHMMDNMTFDGPSLNLHIFLASKEGMRLAEGIEDEELRKIGQEQLERIRKNEERADNINRQQQETPKNEEKTQKTAQEKSQLKIPRGTNEKLKNIREKLIEVAERKGNNPEIKKEILESVKEIEAIEKLETLEEPDPSWREPITKALRRVLILIQYIEGFEKIARWLETLIEAISS